MNPISAKLNQQGFSLLEMLIAMTLITIGLLGMAGLQIASINGYAIARQETQAATWAADRLETLMSLPFTDTDLEDTDADGSGGLADAALADADHNTTRGKYGILWNVADTDLDGDGDQDSKIVAVIVTRNAYGKTKRVTMRNIMANI